jgi:hypothetical protein
LATRSTYRTISLSSAGLIAPILANVEARLRAGEASPTDGQMSTLSQTLVDEDRQRLAHLFTPFFHKYDQDSDGSLSVDELNQLLIDLGEDISQKEVCRRSPRGLTFPQNIERGRRLLILLPIRRHAISPFQPVKEKWNAVTFHNCNCISPESPDAG